MARFFGAIKGNRYWTSRCGTASSGFAVRLKGRVVNVEVEARELPDGRDEIKVFETTRDVGPTGRRLVATVTERMP